MSDQATVELENSELLSPDFPRRSGMSHAEVASNPAAYRSAAAIAGESALVPGILAAQAIERLGRAKHEPAVSLLIRYWSTCPIRDVWMAAGAALLAIGTPDALAALSAHLDEYDPDGRISQIAVLAVFRADPARAYDRLIGHFNGARREGPGGRAVPFRVIKTLGPIGRDARGALQWVDPDAPAWFRADARWLELCVALRLDKQLRDIIAHVLDYVDPAQVAAAVERETAARRKPTRPRRAAVGDLLTRYQKGAHIEVWRELRRFEAIDGAMRAEALAVAAETMRRVAGCCDLVAGRLAAEGWVALSGRLRSPPAPDLAALLAAHEEAAGSPVPPSLLAFWHVVGAVDFVWDYRQARAAPALCPGVDLTDMDPLVIDAAGDPCAMGGSQPDRPALSLGPRRCGLRPTICTRSIRAAATLTASTCPFAALTRPSMASRTTYLSSTISDLRCVGQAFLAWSGTQGCPQSTPSFPS